MHALATDQAQHFEEPGTYRFSGHRDTYGVNQRSRLHTARIGNSAQRQLGRCDVETVEHVECGIEREQMPVHSLDAQMLCYCSGVVLDGVDEKEPRLHRELIEALRARTEQLEDGEEPGVAITKKIVAPDASGFEERLGALRELVGSKAHEVLLVEPVQLLRIEHRVAAADPLER